MFKPYLRAHLSPLLLLLNLLMLASCAVIPPKEPPTLRVAVTHESQDRLRFSGKGAGAGMMLSSSMGPMGIAIGVAIDEGIGKQIDQQIKATEFQIADRLRASLAKALAQDPQHVIEADAAGADVVVHILRYGFVTHPGEGDLVSPQLQLEFHTGEHRQTYHFPAEFKEDDSVTPYLRPLDEIKLDGELAAQVLTAALDVVVARWVEHSRVDPPAQPH